MNKKKGWLERFREQQVREQELAAAPKQVTELTNTETPKVGWLQRMREQHIRENQEPKAEPIKPAYQNAWLQRMHEQSILEKELANAPKKEAEATTNVKKGWLQRFCEEQDREKQEPKVTAVKPAGKDTWLERMSKTK